MLKSQALFSEKVALSPYVIAGLLDMTAEIRQDYCAPPRSVRARFARGTHCLEPQAPRLVRQQEEDRENACHLAGPTYTACERTGQGGRAGRVAETLARSRGSVSCSWGFLIAWSVRRTADSCSCSCSCSVFCFPPRRKKTSTSTSMAEVDPRNPKNSEQTPSFP